MPITCQTQNQYTACVGVSCTRDDLVTSTEKCFNPLQFQVLVILGVVVFVGAMLLGWKLLKVV